MPLPRAGMLKAGAFAADAESRARFAAAFFDKATADSVFAAGSISVDKLVGGTSLEGLELSFASKTTALVHAGQAVNDAKTGALLLASDAIIDLGVSGYGGVDGTTLVGV